MSLRSFTLHDLISRNACLYALKTAFLWCCRNSVQVA